MLGFAHTLMLQWLASSQGFFYRHMIEYGGRTLQYCPIEEGMAWLPAPMTQFEDDMLTASNMAPEQDLPYEDTMFEAAMTMLPETEFVMTPDGLKTYEPIKAEDKADPKIFTGTPTMGLDWGKESKLWSSVVAGKLANPLVDADMADLEIFLNNLINTIAANPHMATNLITLFKGETNPYGEFSVVKSGSTVLETVASASLSELLHALFKKGYGIASVVPEMEHGKFYKLHVDYELCPPDGNIKNSWQLVTAFIAASHTHHSLDDKGKK